MSIGFFYESMKLESLGAVFTNSNNQPVKIIPVDSLSTQWRVME